MEYAKDIISTFKEEFSEQYLNKKWISKQYKLIFENRNPETSHKLEIYLKDKEVLVLKDIYLYLIKQSDEELESEIAYYHKEHDNIDEDLLIYLPPITSTKGDDEKQMTFDGIILKSLSNNHNELSLSSFINSTCISYISEDINKLISLIKASSRAEEFILSKYGKNFLDRIYFEDQTINYYSEELNELTEYTLISNDPVTNCVYYEDEVKIHVTSEFDNCNLIKLISLLNNKQGFCKWFPFISKSKNLKSFSKTKSIYFIESEIPIIQDRELYLFGFISNQILNKGKILFVNRSVDNVDIFKNDYKENISLDNERLFSPSIVFEITIKSENCFVLTMFVDLFHKLKFNDIQLVEIIIKQISKKIFSAIYDQINLETSKNKKINDDANEEVVRYYSALIDNYLKIIEKERLDNKKINNGNNIEFLMEYQNDDDLSDPNEDIADNADRKNDDSSFNRKNSDLDEKDIILNKENIKKSSQILDLVGLNTVNPKKKDEVLVTESKEIFNSIEEEEKSKITDENNESSNRSSVINNSKRINIIKNPTKEKSSKDN